jgi:hypothetical protein
VKFYVRQYSCIFLGEPHSETKLKYAIKFTENGIRFRVLLTIIKDSVGLLAVALCANWSDVMLAIAVTSRNHIMCPVLLFVSHDDYFIASLGYHCIATSSVHQAINITKWYIIGKLLRP